MKALVTLGPVTSPGQIREIITECPELVTDGMDAERELLSRVELPPEAAGLAGARAALISVLATSWTDAELEAAHEAFDHDRGVALAQIAEAACHKAQWLIEHPDAPAEEWNAVAAQPVDLLGFAGETRAKAPLLDTVGAYAARRPGATRARVSWVVLCFRESRELWHDIGDSDQEAIAGSHLTKVLHDSDYGDAYTANVEAEVILRQVLAHYDETANTGILAWEMSNLAAVLLKTAEIDQRRESA